MAWKKIEPKELPDPEMDAGDYLEMALQIALPIVGGAIGSTIPAVGTMAGVGAGQAVGQFATAALQDDPREAKRYVQQGLQAAFTTLPYGIEAYEKWKKEQIPSGSTGTSVPPGMLPNVPRFTGPSGAVGGYQFGDSIGKLPENPNQPYGMNLQEGWLQPPPGAGATPEPLETFVPNPSMFGSNMGSYDPRFKYMPGLGNIPSV